MKSEDVYKRQELSLAQKRSSDFREEMNKFLQKTQRRE